MVGRIIDQHRRIHKHHTILKLIHIKLPKNMHKINEHHVINDQHVINKHIT